MAVVGRAGAGFRPQPLSPARTRHYRPTQPTKPPPTHGNTHTRPQVERVEEVSGSTAGASSAAFHIYRAHRRTELLRLEEIEKRAEEDVRLRLCLWCVVL